MWQTGAEDSVTPGTVSRLAETLLAGAANAGQQGVMETLVKALYTVRSQDFLSSAGVSVLSEIAVVQEKVGDRRSAARSTAETPRIARNDTVSRCLDFSRSC